MSKYHDDSSAASDPGLLRLSRTRLYQIYPNTGLLGKLNIKSPGQRNFEEMLDEHMQLGDSRAATVFSLQPFLVAAYSDELDCSILLSFPSQAASRIGALAIGHRLLTVNTYFSGANVARDLWNGERSYHRYVNFFPVIADFFSRNSERIEHRKLQIGEEEWARCHDCGTEYHRRNPGRFRSGNPKMSHVPA